MNKSKRKLYNSDKINNFRELVERYKTLYSNKNAFVYKQTPHDKHHITVTYREFAKDIEALRNCSFVFRITKQENRHHWS